MADGEIKIKSTIDNSGLEKDAKKTKNILGKLGNSDTTKGLANVGMALTGVGTAVKAVTVVAEKAVKTMTELSEAYKVQAKAEIQLQTAVKNNPYLGSTATNNLKEFAGNMQQLSAIGDETLIPLMAQLASSGRTEAEIMDIISASVDISASGVMSLDSAVTSLNQSLSGSIGHMGRYIPQLKDLNAEELKNGEAIRIAKEQFKGMAQNVADNIGGAQKLSNAMGDLKEELGAGFTEALNPMQTFFAKIIQGWADAKKARREYDEAYKQNESGNGTLASYKTELAGFQKDYEDWLNGLGAKQLITDYNLYGDSILDKDTRLVINEYKLWIDRIHELKETIKELEQAEKAELEARQKGVQEQERAKAEKEVAEYKAKARQELEKNLNTLQLSAELEGREVTAQEKLNAYTSAYISLIANSNGTVTKNNSLAKEWLNIITDLTTANNADAEAEQKRAEKLKNIDDVLTNLINKADKMKSKDDGLLSDAIIKSISDIELQIKEFEAAGVAVDEYKAKLEELRNLLPNVLEVEQQEIEKGNREKWESALNSVASYVDKYAQITSTLTEMAKTQAKNEADVRTAELEKQYKNGEISEKEYYAKKEQIEKESAEKAYRAQMWAWSASILQIGVSTAQSIMNVLGDATIPSTAGRLAMIGAISALGGVQLASAIANKPIPPSYAGGGIVGGGAYARSGTDNIRANIRTGEMVLNDKQQLNLWRMANGSGNSGGIGNNIVVKNYRGNDTSVTPQITEDGIKLIIRKTVSDDLASGQFNKQLLSANNTMSGIAYES